MSVFVQPIYAQTVGAGGASTVTFNNIPQGFTDLKIVISTRSSSSEIYDGCLMQINGTSGNLYSTTGLQGNGTTVYSARNFGGGAVNYLDGVGNGATASTFGNVEIYIPNYTGGNYKTIQQDVAPENNATLNYLTLASSMWRSANPITSVTFFCSGGFTFLQNSTFTLYGVSAVYDTAVPTAPTIGAVTDQAGFASVAFTAAPNDQAENYVVTSTPVGSTTYGPTSPIITPAVLGTSYTYRVASVNALGTNPSAASAALTTDNSYASIATVPFTDSSSAAAYFTNIPQNYRHLQLRCFVRMASSQSTPYDLTVTVNGSNTSGDYTYHMMRGDGASTSLAGLASDNVLRYPVSVPNGSMTSGIFGVVIVDILNYTDTGKNKTTRALFGYDNNGGSAPTAGWTGLSSSAWYQQAPISSLIVASFGNFAQYSHVALYGIA
jgi:hypothetical protein